MLPQVVKRVGVPELAQLDAQEGMALVALLVRPDGERTHTFLPRHLALPSSWGCRLSEAATPEVRRRGCGTRVVVSLRR